MKLLFCKKCQDVFKLHKGKMFECLCGKSKGYYLQDESALISGECIPVGFANSSFADAINNRKKVKSETFEAFIIPEKCKTVKYVKNLTGIPARHYDFDTHIGYFITFDLLNQYHTKEEVNIFKSWAEGQTVAVVTRNNRSVSAIYSWDYERWLANKKEMRQGANWD